MIKRLAALAAVALALAALGAWLLTRGSDQPAGTEVVAADPAPGSSTPASADARPPPDRLPASSDSTGSRRPELSVEAPADAYPLVWVRKGREVEMRTEPGGGELVESIGKRTEFGSPTVLGVVRDQGGWAGVTTPALPNDRLGWVRLDPRKLRSGWTRLSVVVDLSERRAELRRAGKRMRSFVVTVGAPGYDTPTGRFAVTDTFRGNLSSAYGCCAVALSANQPNLPSGWLGGSRIAIHGTSGPLGIAASHGCVRAADSDVDALVERVVLGTPVFIRA